MSESIIDDRSEDIECTVIHLFKHPEELLKQFIVGKNRCFFESKRYPIFELNIPYSIEGEAGLVNLSVEGAHLDQLSYVEILLVGLKDVDCQDISQVEEFFNRVAGVVKLRESVRTGIYEY